MYPEYAEINGKEYKIDTDFNTALKCFEINDDDSITNYEKVYATVYLLFDFIPDKDIDLFFEKAKIFLQCGKTDEEQNNNKVDMDFKQDRGYINSSFMSDYRIDLSREKLHFWQFIELLEGLTENSVLSRIRNLRDTDLSEISDEKTRKKIAEAQESVALKKKKKVLTKEQNESVRKFCEAMGIERK